MLALADCPKCIKVRMPLTARFGGGLVALCFPCPSRRKYCAWHKAWSVAFVFRVSTTTNSLFVTVARTVVSNAPLQRPTQHHHTCLCPHACSLCLTPPCLAAAPSLSLLRPFAPLCTKVRAEQALLTELESEWLNQFWVQGRKHAILHPWWRGPMALVLATWRELERRTALTVQRLMSLRDEGLGVGGAWPAAAEPAAIARAFETLLRVLEERRESRSRWSSRFADPAYRSLSADCLPVVPALWPAAHGGEGSGGCGGGGDGAGSPLLPQSLAGSISRLRECYTVVYRAASGGTKAGSAKAIAAGAASNWELFRAGSSPPSSSAKINGAPNHQQQPRQKGDGGRAGGKDGKKRPAESSIVGGRTGGGGAGGRGPKRKRSNKRGGKEKSSN